MRATCEYCGHLSADEYHEHNANTCRRRVAIQMADLRSRIDEMSDRIDIIKRQYEEARGYCQRAENRAEEAERLARILFTGKNIVDPPDWIWPDKDGAK